MTCQNPLSNAELNTAWFRREGWDDPDFKVRWNGVYWEDQKENNVNIHVIRQQLRTDWRMV